MAGRKGKLTLVTILVILLIIYILYSLAKGWAPSRGTYPLQGVLVDQSHGDPTWSTLGATGVDFAYLTASQSSDQRDESYSANLSGVKEAGIRYGPLHVFDVCRLATDQATLFNTTVPRDPDALPPAVKIGFSQNCTSKPNRELILSEISTFLGQIELHLEKPAILLIEPDFEEYYNISQAVDRNMWTMGDYFVPSYTARPWTMWTANESRDIDGVDTAVPWVVLR